MTLEPCCNDPEPNAQGRASGTIVAFTRLGTVLEFSAVKVEFPVPSAGLGISDPTTADIRLVLRRGETDYAECFLAFEPCQSVEGEDAVFKLQVGEFTRRGRGVLKGIKGQCDLDLRTLGIQAGVPELQNGDVATVRVVDTATSTVTDFLQGTVQLKH